MTYRVAQPPSPLPFSYHILSTHQKIDRVARDSIVMVAALVSLGLLADYAWDAPPPPTPRRLLSALTAHHRLSRLRRLLQCPPPEPSSGSV
jgi:hypothetical protein